jgi:hypothetical protein
MDKTNVNKLQQFEMLMVTNKFVLRMKIFIIFT